MPMKNVFVEGIQGMGKSTLVNHLVAAVPELRVCREGDYSPIDLAWCTWMSGKEYETVLTHYESIRDEIVRKTVKETINGQEYFIVSYTQILTDLPNFHKDLERYEIYNGRKSLTELKEIILSRYRKFDETGYLFECAFFQNIIEDLILFHLLTDDEIVEFYRELYGCIDQEHFLLLYLNDDRLEENIKAIKAERCDNQGNELWYPIMLDYLIHSPYGRQNGYSTFEDMIAHFRHRQQLELRIIEEIIGDRAVILPAKKWKLEDIV